MKKLKNWFIPIIAVVFLLGSIPVQAINLRVLIDPTDNSRRQEFDTMFKAPVIMDTAEHELHEGNSFTVTVVDTSMTTSDTLSISFKTPDSAKLFHMILSAEFKAAAHLNIDEGGTWTAETGTATTIFNRLRDGTLGTSGILENADQAAFTANGAVILNATGYAEVLVLTTVYTFSQGVLGGGSRAVEEIILDRNQTYVFIITADAGSNGAWMQLSWHEHAAE